jgi:hypothetical protein
VVAAALSEMEYRDPFLLTTLAGAGNRTMLDTSSCSSSSSSNSNNNSNSNIRSHTEQ